MIDDKYNIALQKIIESFTHYLALNDGYGDVIYESRNTIGENSTKSPDIKLINVYHKIQANNKGIVYTNSLAIQDRNRTIAVYPKSENIAGLQFADFVAYNITKFNECKIEQQITDFMKQIHKIAYNGGHPVSEKDQRSFWGMRVLPSYLRMEKLLSENKTLKNAYANLKKERNKQNKRITRLSVSTKIGEYLGSERCIIAFGPQDIASIEYIQNKNLGLVLPVNSIENSICLLEQIIENTDFRRQFIENAKLEFNNRYNQRYISNSIYKIVSQATRQT